MLGIELQQTRVYQEARLEGKAEGETIGEVRGLERGRTEGEQALVLRLLTRKLGKIDSKTRSRISNLKIDLIESLGEALLDFSSIADLEAWLSQN
jgi:predicted transposase YdaD